ncbi:hypothetical protein HMPREF9370_2178, partial [Neisseria wadsworthii 9715]
IINQLKKTTYVILGLDPSILSFSKFWDTRVKPEYDGNITM